MSGSGVNAAHLVTDTRDTPAGGLASPLPVVSSAAARLIGLLTTRNVVALPTFYTPVVTNPGAQRGTVVLELDPSEGPVFVTMLRPRWSLVDGFTTGKLYATMSVQTSGRQLTEGVVVARDVLVDLASNGIPGMLDSPILIGEGEQLIIELSGANNATQWAATEGFDVYGYSLRLGNGDDVNKLYADMVREGEWYASGVLTTKGTDYLTFTGGDIIIEAGLVQSRVAVVEGEVNATATRLQIDTHWVTPNEIVPGPLDGATIPYMRMRGMRMPVKGPSKGQVRTTFPTGTPVQVRAQLVGRRGYTSVCD